jgi:hypothetical protein
MKDSMALEYTCYSAADLPTEELRSLLAVAIGGVVTADGTVVREGLTAAAWREAPGEEASAPRLFGFVHRITVLFRLWNNMRPEVEEHNTALIVIAVLRILEQTGADSVLLFNGEEAVIQTIGGSAVFDADREEWEFPEAAALLKGRRVERLSQPLLPPRPAGEEGSTPAL